MKNNKLSFISGLAVFALLISIFGGSIGANALSIDGMDVRSSVYGDENEDITDDVYEEDDVRDDVYGEDNDDVTDDVYEEDNDDVTDDVYEDDDIDYDEDLDIDYDETVTENAYHFIGDKESLDVYKDKNGNIAPVVATNIILSGNALSSVANDKKVIMKQEGIKLVMPASALKKALGNYSLIRVDVEDVSDNAKYKGALSQVFSFNIFRDYTERFNGKFSEPFEATFNVDPSKVKNWDDLVLRYFDDKGNVTDYANQIVSYNKETGEVVAMIHHFSTYGIFEVPGSGAKKQEENATGPVGQGGSDNGKDANGSAIGNRLPDTATNLFNYLMIGGVLLLAGASALVFKKKKSVNA